METSQSGSRVVVLEPKTYTTTRGQSVVSHARFRKIIGSLCSSVSSAMDAYDIIAKVVMVGDSCVGKTCMILRYSQDIFRENFLSTIGN